ncbi:hypothetical protein V2G26_013336 [Clonostachys chloroleuca]
MRRMGLLSNPSLVNNSVAAKQGLKWEYFYQDIAWWFTWQYHFLDFWTGTEATLKLTEAHIPPITTE